MVREWQDHLVKEYVEAVKSNDTEKMALAAHNLAVHLAPTPETFTVVKKILAAGTRVNREFDWGHRRLPRPWGRSLRDYESE